MDPNSEAALRSATAIGLITLPIGIAVTAAPSRVARVLRLGDHPRALRAIGVADLALVPGLLAGGRRWQWMTARAGLNLVIVRCDAAVTWTARRQTPGMGVLPSNRPGR